MNWESFPNSRSEGPKVFDRVFLDRLVPGHCNHFSDLAPAVLPFGLVQRADDLCRQLIRSSMPVVMKRIIIVCLYLLGFALSQAPSVVCAQSTNAAPHWWTNLPSDWTNHPPAWTNVPPILTNLPPAWTNILRGLRNRSPWGTNMWWTNRLSFTNSLPPRAITNRHGIILPGKTAPPDLPRDVQALLQQFQQERNQLASSLQGATDAQRQQILQQLSQMRDQLQAQLKDMTQRNREQLDDMRKAFGQHFGPGNAPGGGSTPTGHGGKPQ